MQSLNAAEPFMRLNARVNDLVAINERAVAQQNSANREPANIQLCAELHPAAPFRTMTSIFENPYVALLEREPLRKFDIGISKLFAARMKKAPDDQVIAMMEAIVADAGVIEIMLSEHSMAIQVIRDGLNLVRVKENGKRPLNEPENAFQLYGKTIGATPPIQLAIDHATQLTDPNVGGMLGSEWSVDGAYIAMHGNCDEEARQRDISVCLTRMVSAMAEMNALHNVALDTKERLIDEIKRLKELKE